MAADVFISYSRHDQERIVPLVQQLQAAGVSVWIDQRRIDGATLWGQEIVGAIEGCKVLLLMVSTASAESPYVLKEVGLASEGNKPILPLLLEPIPIPKALRFYLVGIQRIELFQGDPEDHFEAILRSFSHIGIQTRAPEEAARAGLPAVERIDRSSAGLQTAQPTLRKGGEAATAEPRLNRQAGGGEYEPVGPRLSGPPPSWPAGAGPSPRIEERSSAGSSPASAVPRGTQAALLKVAILYKRKAEPDEQLLKLLETALRQQGHEVFIDRHLAIGVEWAKEIERQLRAADAVIPLISPSSMQSEMLAYEVQIAHEAAQEQQGKPRLLPVRVNYTGPHSPSLAPFLDPLHYALWEGPQDDERVVAGLRNALQSAAVPECSVILKDLEPVGGAVPLASPYYVVRPTDEAFGAAIARQDCIVLVKGARQMGKTSLLARGLQQARASGARVVLTDFQKLHAAHFESPDKLFLTLAAVIARQLGLDLRPRDTWDASGAANINFEWFLRYEVMDRISEPFVWGLDEVDRLFTCCFSGEFFGLLRSWHNERALDPTGPWARMTLAIAYATEAHLFITDMNQSPFNVGTPVLLEDFAFEHVADLNQRHGSPLRNDAEVSRFCRLVGGQPYMVRRGLHEMTTRGIEISAFEDLADREEGIYGDHLRRILVLLAQDPALCDVVRGVLQGRPCPDTRSFYRLRSAGVLGGDSARDARPRCQLYATYLERHLL